MSFVAASSLGKWPRILTARLSFAFRALMAVRRVDDPAHRLREGEEGNDSVPVAPPGLRDGGIFSPPGAGIESVERRLAGVGVLGPVDHAQRRHDRLAIFPRDELQR